MMFLTKRFNLGFVLMLYCILLPACGPSPEELAATSAAETAAAATSTFTITPTTTLTSIPPTATSTPSYGPLPGLIPKGIILTFTGDECTGSGPIEVKPGEYTIVLRNLTEKSNSIYVAYLLEGKTYQDLVKAQGKPDWVVYADMIDGWRDEGNNERFLTVSLEEGEHALYIGSNKPSLWFCAPLRVVK
jgi:hypothetical protein